MWLHEGSWQTDRCRDYGSCHECEKTQLVELYTRPAHTLYVWPTSRAAVVLRHERRAFAQSQVVSVRTYGEVVCTHHAGQG